MSDALSPVGLLSVSKKLGAPCSLRSRYTETHPPDFVLACITSEGLPTSETRKVAAILFTDISGYSRLMREDDGLLLEFPSVVVAVERALPFKS